MAALDLLTRRRPALDHVERFEQYLEPLAGFDVRLGRVQLSERRVAYVLDRRTASASVSTSTLPRARPTR
jgi:hypothetical protein